MANKIGENMANKKQKIMKNKVGWESFGIKDLFQEVIRG